MNTRREHIYKKRKKEKRNKPRSCR